MLWSSCGSHLDFQVFLCAPFRGQCQVIQTSKYFNRFSTLECNQLNSSVVSLSIKLHPALMWRWAAQLFSLQPTTAMWLNAPSMGTATLSGSTTAVPIPSNKPDHGGGWSCLVCTGCQRSRSPIGIPLGRGWTASKYSSGIHWRTTATIIQGESPVAPTLLSPNILLDSQPKRSWFDPYWPTFNCLMKRQW